MMKHTYLAVRAEGKTSFLDKKPFGKFCKECNCTEVRKFGYH